MADLIAYQTGDWTGATTWKGVATSTGAKQATTTSSTTTTTSYVYSSTFTVTNLVVIEGLLLYCNRVNTTGTVSVALSDDNGTTATRAVTVNASDLPDSPAWVFFKFGSTLTGDGGTDYRVGVTSSSAGNATFFRDGTAGNWARYLRTNSTATAAAADVTFICDELTGAGAKTDIEVTMNSTATTSYGQVNIGQGGILSYGTAGSTNYHLKLAGILNVWGGGTLNIGTSGTPIPRTSTASLEFANVTNVDFGLEVRSGGTFNAYGLSRTSGNNSYWCLLNTDEAIGSTSLGVNTDTGWLDNDEIVIAPTNLTGGITEYERGRLNGNATATTLTVDGFAGAGGGLAYAHSGTTPTQAEIILLTRNVRIFGTSSALQAYITFSGSAVVNMQWIQMYFLGSTTSNKRGLDVANTSGTCTIQYCSTHDLSVGNITGSSIQIAASHTNAVTYQYNVGYFHSGPFIQVGAASVTHSIDNNIWIRTNGTGVLLNDVGTTFTNNRVIGAGTGAGGVVLNEAAATLGTFTDNVIHHTTTIGISTSDVGAGTIANCTIWRTNNSVTTNGGLSLSGTANVRSLVVNNCTVLADGLACVLLNGIVYAEFNNCTFANLSGATSPTGLRLIRTDLAVFNNCDFGSTTAPYGSFGTSDITCANRSTGKVLLNNCFLRSTTEVANNYDLTSQGIIAAQRLDQTNNNHVSWRLHGKNSVDTTFFRTASPSERLTPDAVGSNKHSSGSKKLAVANGTTATISVWVRESVSGDGTDYNGDRPRLIVKRNEAAGITSDTVLATATSASEGAWERLSGTTASVIDNAVLEVYVDCNGTTGWVNVDDWSVS